MAESPQELLTQREPYIADDGFTRRVMESLPAPPASRRYRQPILLGLGLLGFVIAFVIFPGVEHLARSVIELAHLRASLTEFPLAALVIVAMTILGASVVVIWSEEST